MNKTKIYTFVCAMTLAAPGLPAGAADYLAEGHNAFLQYDFDLARELYDKYAKTLAKRPDAEGERLLEIYERELDIAESSLDNVQKIEIIDRIDVPLEDFVSKIAIPAGAGKLIDKDRIPLEGRSNSSDYLYSAPSGDLVMWTEVDGEGTSHLFESNKLVDGSWEAAHEDPVLLNEGGDVKNPFMLSDGVTVYFAGNGDDSMGGYDLFVATKNPSTGEFRQPTPMGFPFNSPYDEYMMAVDEENGIGWWVSDRNQLDGKVSVYVFYTNAVRKNYNPDEEEDIVALARLDDISLAQDPGKDYSGVMREIEKRSKAASGSGEGEVILRLPGHRAIRQPSDLKSSAARKNLSQYLAAMEEYDANCGHLKALRMKYHKAGKGASMALKNQILDLEKTLDWQRDKLKKMRNAIISAETK